MLTLIFYETNSAKSASKDVGVLSTTISSATSYHPQNHIMFKFGRYLKDPLVPAPCHVQGHHSLSQVV